MQRLTDLRPPQLVRRALHLSYDLAGSGRDDAARAAWMLAIRFAWRCGGISGSCLDGGIVLADGLCSWPPVRLRIDAVESSR